MSSPPPEFERDGAPLDARLEDAPPATSSPLAPVAATVVVLLALQLVGVVPLWTVVLALAAGALFVAGERRT